jgi:hypothetical protein
MEQFPDSTRQQMRCGYLPVVEGAVAWCHSGIERPKSDTPFPSVCPGFSTRLPEVVEISRLRAHWHNGALRDACEGPPTRLVLGGLELLESECNARDSWKMTPVSKGGGRAD